MRLTKKKAIELSVELWTWLAKTGKLKCEWPGWDQYGTILAHCFLCEYATRHSGCGSCPYRLRFVYCCTTNSPYDRWDRAETVEAKKKYARLFLEQLKQL